MNIPKEFLIDVGLNVAMSVLAGAAWMVLFSMIRRPGRRQSPRVKQAPLHQAENTGQGRRVESRPIEFVNLRQPADIDIEVSRETGTVGSEMYRRNRTEVMRMAREMLATGSTREGIRRRLPISEGELAMLANR